MMNRFLLCIFLLLLPLKLLPQVLVNEFSSANISIPDEDGDYNDWIELYNNSSTEQNLGGYYLSDDASFIKKWTLPSIKINPHSYLLIYASGKNRTDIPVNYKTIIPRDAEWRYLVPSAEPPVSWKTVGFDAFAWQSGKSGFGYGDNDDSTVLDKISSVFIRKEFTLTGIDEIREIVLSIDYDDGFIAFINGHEIARSNVGTTASIPYNRLTGIDREATIYSGGFPENFLTTDPSSFLLEGTNVIAIQGYNNSTGSTDFSLIPILTIGRSATSVTDSVPSYVNLRGRKLHAGFKIDADGESLILASPDSSIVDLVQPVRLTNNLSWGRQPDGGPEWLFFDDPTPCGPNDTRGFSALSIDTIIFSAKGGYYPSGFELSLSSIRQSDSIFYSLDGTEPTVNSSRYTGPFSISGNSVVRARSIKAGMMPGVISTNSYFTLRHAYPVICISTDPPNLWDYYSGIYVLGPNAAAANPHFGANFWQDWEKRAHMELYDVNGNRQIDQDVGLKIFGAWSRAHAQKSFALFARKEYGKGSFEYRFFSDKPIEKFESIVLRNGGNDWGRALFRDGLTSILVHDMDIDRSAIQPAIVYLNGEYWGILNLREKISDNYLAENYSIDPDNINLLESNSKVIDGSNKTYTDLIDYLNNNTLENDTKYQQAKTRIDVNNYIQYQFTQVFIDNKDWPGNNIKYWSTNDAGSLWRWILYDTDFGFSIYDVNAHAFNTLAYALAPDSQDGSNRPWATLLFRRMMSNAGFRNEFANQYADRMNRNFSSSRIIAVTDSLKQVYLPEIKPHLSRWDLNYNYWLNSIGNIIVFANNRPAAARSHLRTQLNLGSPVEIKVEIANPGTGKARVNSIVPYRFPFSGIYFKDLPIRLTALPAPGYKFVKWVMGPQVSNSPSLTYNMEGPQTFSAVFESARNLDIKIVINEISYNSSPERDAEDWVELYNAGQATVNLKDWIVSDEGSEAGFRFPSNFILYPGMYVIVCRDQAAFRGCWNKVSNTTGDMEFGLSSSGDHVNLYDPDGNLVDFVEYLTASPWPANVPEGGSIELADPLSDNNDGNNWKASSTGTPGARNSNASDDTVIPPVNELRLSCFPSPFRDFSTFRVEIAEAGRYRIDIYNALGRLVNTLTDQTIEQGIYNFDWYGDDGSGASLPAGVYIVRLSGNNQHFTTRVVYLK